MTTETTDPTVVLANPTPPPMPRSATAVDMTTRDFFAAHAFQGLLAAHTSDVELPDAKKAAKWSREYADALLLELSSTPFPV